METRRRDERASERDWIMLTAMVALLCPFLVAFSALLLLVLATAIPLVLLLPVVLQPPREEGGQAATPVGDHRLLPDI